MLNCKKLTESWEVKKLKPTKQLMEEHNAIKLMLKILDAVGKKLQSGEKVDFEHLDQILEFLRTFADKCHHGKEESLLFPAMEKAGIPREGGPIGVMVREHEIGRGFIKELSNAINDYKRGKMDVILNIVGIAKSYIELLAQHIEKEDNILFPIADNILTQEVQEKLLEEFEKTESEQISANKHEELLQLLNRLKKIYME